MFAWRHEQMLRVNPEVACHRLDINPNAKLVKKKPRRMNLNRRAQVQAKVKCLSI